MLGLAFGKCTVFQDPLPSVGLGRTPLDENHIAVLIKYLERVFLKNHIWDATETQASGTGV